MDTHLELLFSMASLHTKMTKELEKKLSLHGISFSEFLVMYELSKMPHASMRRVDVAESIGMSPSGVTRLLQPMEKLHIIEKETHPRDARVSFVKLSETGSVLLQEALLSVAEVAESFFEILTQEKRDNFLNILKSLK